MDLECIIKCTKPFSAEYAGRLADLWSYVVIKQACTAAIGLSVILVAWKIIHIGCQWLQRAEKESRNERWSKELVKHPSSISMSTHLNIE